MSLFIYFSWVFSDVPWLCEMGREIQSNELYYKLETIENHVVCSLATRPASALHFTARLQGWDKLLSICVPADIGLGGHI